MINIDKSLLVSLGVDDVATAKQNILLRTIYEVLETRVGMELASQMSNEQLDEFERFYEAKDDAGAFAWLERQFPAYQRLVADSFAQLKTEIADYRVEVRRLLLSEAPAELVDLIHDVVSSPEQAALLARDVFIFVGGLDRIRSTGYEALDRVPGMTQAVADQIRQVCEHGVSAPERPTGLPRSLVDDLLSRYGSWARIAKAHDDELLAMKGMGRGRLARIRSA